MVAALALERQTETATKPFCEILNDLDEGYIFIAGPTCSGKTTLAYSLSNFFFSRFISVSVIKQDDYFKDLKDIPKSPKGYMTDSIDAFHIEEMVNDIISYIKNGKAQLPLYDIANNRRLREKQKILKTQVTIIEGLHTISLFHELLDGIFIYLNTSIEVCLSRRISRDKFKFNVPEERIIEHFNDCIIPSYYKDILPQRDMNGVIIYEASTEEG